MKTLKEIKTYLSKLSEQNKKDIAEAEKTITELDKIIAANNEKLDKAAKAANYDSYDKAKKELWTAQNKKELAQKHLEDLNTLPLVNREEYDRLLNSILAAHKNNEQELTEQAWEIVSPLKNIKEKAQESQENLRELLDTLENDIGKKSEEYKHNANREKISDRMLGLVYSHVKPSAVVSLYDNIAKLSIFGTVKK